MRPLRVLVALIPMMLLGQGAARADFMATATLLGANERPTPTSSTATGFASVMYDAANDSLVYNVMFMGLASPATASHIHFGGNGVAGPVILPFTNQGPPAATSGMFSGTLTAADLINQATSGITTIAQAAAAIQAGNAYVNIHSATFPGGEVRGQLAVVPEPSSLVLLGLGACGLLVLGRKGSGA